MKKSTVCAAAVIAAGAAVAAGLPYGRIDEDIQEIETDRIDDRITICVLSDLHCRMFGKNQERIVRRVRKMNPDLIVIPGDLFDYDRNYDHAFTLMTELRDYPIYFTSGNHDVYLKEDIEMLRNELRNAGVHVLEDHGEVFTKNNSEVEMFGLCDHGRKPIITAEDTDCLYHTGGFRVLISHRPDFMDLYRGVQVDLTICGHDHGGQWRIPFTHQGIYAPGKGLFPKYTEGMHVFGRNHLYISRGLASGCPVIPRLYNNPEIGWIILKPAGSE